MKNIVTQICIDERKNEVCTESSSKRHTHYLCKAADDERPLVPFAKPAKVNANVDRRYPAAASETRRQKPLLSRMAQLLPPNDKNTPCSAASPGRCN